MKIQLIEFFCYVHLNKIYIQVVFLSYKMLENSFWCGKNYTFLLKSIKNFKLKTKIYLKVRKIPLLVSMHSNEIEMDKIHEELKFSSLFYTPSSAIFNFIRVLLEKISFVGKFFINTLQCTG